MDIDIANTRLQRVYPLQKGICYVNKISVILLREKMLIQYKWSDRYHMSHSTYIEEAMDYGNTKSVIRNW